MKIVNVQNTGKQSFITLPKKICESLKIEKGSALIVKEVDGKIIIEKVG